MNIGEILGSKINGDLYPIDMADHHFVIIKPINY